MQKLFFDLNAGVYFSHVFERLQEGVTNVFRKNGFCSSHGIPADVRIPKMCSALSRQLQNQRVFLPGSVFLHGLCSNNLPPKFARYCNLPESDEQQTLSYGHQVSSVPQYFIKRQQYKRLAHLCRLRTSPNSFSQGFVYQRTLWSRSKRNCLCIGLNNNRFMPIAFSLGQVSQDQSRDQNAYASGFTWPDTIFRRDNASKNSRCEYSRHTRSGVRRFLHHGSRVSRFRKALPVQSSSGFLYHTRKGQLQMPAHLLPFRRQNNRITFRSNSAFDWFLFLKAFPRTHKTDSFLRQRTKQIFHFPDKQFCAPGLNYRSSIQASLGSRAFFQMDQATSAHQGILRHFRKCRQVSNLDRHQRLHLNRYYQKAFEYQNESLHFFTDSKHHNFRENGHFSTRYRKQ